MYRYQKETKGWSVYYKEQYLGTAYGAKTQSQALKILLEK